MKKILLAILLYILTIPTSLAFAGTTDQEIVTEFKQLSSEKIESFKARNNDIITFMPKEVLVNEVVQARWIKDKYIPHDDYKIDVQKTSSLISPYIGTLIFTLDRYVVLSYLSKEDAEEKAYPPLDIGDQCEYKYTYAYQDGKWVITEKKWRHPFSRFESLRLWRDGGAD